MKARIYLFLSFFLSGLVPAFAQNAGDFRTVASGDWNAAATWQTFDGTNWVAATAYPSKVDGRITVAGGHTLTIPATITITADQITVQENAQILIAADGLLDLVNGTGTDLDIAQAVGGTIPGIVKVSGILKANNDATIVSAANSLIAENGGTYQHHYSVSSGNIPLATWNIGSALLISGYTTNELAPGNLRQAFHHVVWNTPDLNNTQGFINLGGALKTVNGNLTVSSTGLSALYFTETTEILVIKEGFILDNNRKVKINAPTEVTSSIHLLNSTLDNMAGLSLADGATFLFEGNSVLKGVAPVAAGSYHIHYKNLSTTFTPGPELPLSETSLAGLTIENGTLPLTAPLTLNGNLSLATAGALKLNGYELSLKGNFVNDGNFDAGTNKVVFNGTGTQTIEGTMETTFYTLEVSNTAAPGLTAKQHTNISHTLTLGENVTIDPDGGEMATDGGINFTLLSSSFPHAASIAPLPATALIAGKVVVQRFIPPPPATENKYIATSTKGTTVSQWTDDFIINGPYEGGNGAASSAFIFDEYKVANSSNPYVEWPGAAGSLNTPVEVGKGYAANWFETAMSIIIDTRGEPTTGNFTLPVSYTAEGTSTNKGFNLIGNPYPSAIDWGSPAWQRQDMSPTAFVFIREGGAASRITWNSVTGIGLNSSNNTIPAGQAFFVKALSSSASLVATENIKVPDPATDMQKAIKDVVVVSFFNGTFRDQTAIAFREGATAGYDPLLDSEKTKNGTINLYSVSTEGKNLSQNIQPWFTGCSFTFPLAMDQAAAGVYHLNFSHLSSLSRGVAIVLQDNFLNTSTAVTSETIYNFDITSDPLTYGPNRFSLEFTYTNIPEISSVTYEPSCTGSIPITVNGTVSGANYQLFIGTTAIAEPVGATSGTTIIPVSSASLTEGNNTLTIKAFNPGCDVITMATDLLLDYSGNYTISNSTGASSCTTGSVTLSATASSERSSFRWYETADATAPVFEAATGSFTTPILTATKIYYVAAVNTYGCESARVATEAVILTVPEITSATYEGSCSEGIPVTVNGTVSGKNYQLFKGTTAITDPVAATSAVTSFTISKTSLTEGNNTISIKGYHAGCEPVTMATDLLLDYSGNYTISNSTGASSCTTGSVTLSATASSERSSFRWYETADATAPVFEAAIGSFTTPILTATKIYYVAAVNTYGCESARVATEAAILTVPEITSLTYEPSCTGSIPVTVNGTVAGFNYQLFNGPTAVTEAVAAGSEVTSFNISAANLAEGNNTITVKALHTGCDPVSMATELLLDYSGSYTISSSTGASSCTSAALTLSATASSERASFRWYETKDATTPVFEASTGSYNTPVLTASITYFVAAVNNYGCESARVATEAVIQNFTQPLITIQSEALVSDYENGNQWFLNGQPIPEATGNNVSPVESGTYGLEVNHNGCTLVAENIQFTVTGTKATEKEKFPLFYPNPAAEKIHIRQSLFENAEEVYYSIYQANGTILQDGKVEGSDQTIDLDLLKTGLYVIKVVKGKNIYFEKLFKD